jgi:hypothetical protein
MIVYTPIDIPCPVPDHKLLVNYVNNNHMTNLVDTYGYTSLLAAIVSRYPINDWRNANDVFADAGYELRPTQHLFFAPNVTVLFPELFQILFALPYKQILGAALNLHTKYLPPHNDEVDTNYPSSPERYNVLLSPHYDQDSFFICKEKTGQRDYPTILKDYPIYAFNNKDIYHGADPVLDQRVIMVCSGIIDEEKHQKLINRSVEKFEEHVIRYKD